MRWRNVMIGGGTSLAAAAAFNALASRGVRPLANVLGGEEGWLDWRGHRIAHTRVGSGPPLLLVHGVYAGAWSFEWRRNVDALAEHHTVHALDLLGFGRSARPRLKYTAALYQQLVHDFAVHVVREPCILVASSLSAAHVVPVAARDAARFPALVLVGPTGIAQLRDDPTMAGESLRWLVESPLVGTSVYNSLVTRAGIRRVLEPMYSDAARVTPQLVEAYYQASHQPGAKHAVAAFVAGQLNVDVRAAVRRLQQPTLLVWGRRARQVPLEQAHGFRVLKPDVQLEVVDGAGDLPHDERADRFNERVLEFARGLGATARVLGMKTRARGA